MRIPLVDLVAGYAAIRGEIDAAIAEVLGGASFIMGPHVAEFERRFAVWTGARRAVGVANGTEAVRLALLACGIGPGDEVITVADTFIATAEAISACGATPVFVDVDAATHTIDPARIEPRVTPRTRAIVCVHLYGHACDLDPILEIAGRRGLAVIEDCAQCHGGRYKGRPLGTIGRIGCFSMFPAKILGAFGDAGAIVTDDERLAETVARLRDHGRTSKHESAAIGCNARLDALQARILTVKLAHVDRWIAERRRLAAAYDAALAGLVGTPIVHEWAFHPFYMYVIRTPRRDALRAHLEANGIGCGVHYPVPIHLQGAYAHLGYRRGDLPETERAADEVLSLPLYPELTEAQQAFVVAAIAELLGRDG
jgi:dTDP-4-amino-4,6-dideoxygalactose transaminase